MISAGAVAASATAKRRRNQQQNNEKRNHVDYYSGFYIKVQQGFFRKTIGWIYSVNKDNLTYKKTEDFTKKKIYYHAGEHDECFNICKLLNEKYRSQGLNFNVDNIEVKEFVSYDEKGKEHIDVVHW